MLIFAAPAHAVWPPASASYSKLNVALERGLGDSFDHIRNILSACWHDNAAWNEFLLKGSAIRSDAINIFWAVWKEDLSWKGAG